jgi:hypothetical protein
MSMTQELSSFNERRAEASKQRYREAKARVEGQGKTVTEYTLAAEVGSPMSTVAIFLRFHPQFALEMGIIQIFRNGERIRQKSKARYRAAAESIRARGERVTYATLSEQLGVKPSAVQSYFSAKRKFAQVLGVTAR